MRISSTLLRRFRSQEGFWSKRNLPHPDACGIENSIANGGCNDRDRRLPGAGNRRVQVINQDRNDFGNCVAELQNRETVAEQIEGRSAVGEPGMRSAGPGARGTAIAGTPPSNPMSDPSGDARFPHFSPTMPGPNQGAMDFTRLAVDQPDATHLRMAGPWGIGGGLGEHSRSPDKKRWRHRRFHASLTPVCK